MPGGAPLAILSYAVWQRLFCRNPDIIGHSIQLRGAPYTVIGVMPAGFIAPGHSITGDEAPVGVWTPLHPTTTGEGAYANYDIIARLRAGATFAQANAELNSIIRDILNGAKQAGVVVQEEAVPLQTGETYEVRRSVHVMWGAVVIVLLIGCVNIAGLLLARSASRARDIATRLAVGATRTAIIGELLAECLLLALAGGIIGLLIGNYALHVLLRLNPGAFEIWGSITLDARIIVIMMARVIGHDHPLWPFPRSRNNSG